MIDLNRDPYFNAIQQGIKHDISVLLENECPRGAIILIHAAIDAMAYLGMPKEKDWVEQIDFMYWADKYIRFPCQEQLTGAELYAARCAILHSYTVESKMSARGMCRRILYMGESIPEIRYNPTVSEENVLVSLPALKDALFCGIDRFMVDAFSHPEKKLVVEERLRKFILRIPVEPTN